MAHLSLLELIKFIVWYATDNSISLSTNRLVKLLYLVDVFHARLSGGSTLTSLPWAFVSYGPFCREALDAVNQAAELGIVSAMTYESKFGEKDYRIFSCDSKEAEGLEGMLHPIESGQLKQVIKKLGDDTPALLDLVYFHTEPMEQPIVKHQRLDFTRCRPFAVIKKVEPPKLSRTTIEEAKKHLNALKLEMDAGKSNLLNDAKSSVKYFDDKYEVFLKTLEEDELPTGLIGSARIE